MGDAGDSAYEGAKDAAKEATRGTGKPGESQPAPDTPHGSESPAGTKSSSEKVAKTGGDSGAGEMSIVQAETVYSKYDFIPGDKMIFFDDFSDTDVGEFPRKWTLKGPAGGGNQVEVIDYKGKRFLRSVPPAKNEGIPASTLYVRLNTKGDLPEKFTVEFDAVLGKPTGYQNQYYVLMYDESGWPTRTPGTIYIAGDKGQSQNTTTSIDKDDGKVHHVAVSVNGTFVKAYVDNQRVVNDPDAVTRPMKYIGISLHANHGYSDTIMFTNFRLAEGGKNIKSALDTDGKIVTHGILFDTGKEVIKPESLPTLKMILGVLTADPGLKFSIEGHTDNQGNKAINQPLSEKRSAAVKNWLTGKGIEEARLKTKGFGDTKPIDSNATPEGRANNRRVEFVKF
ncbi:MAG: OmpA family protein [Verrucomicrobiota bacterium]